MDRERNSPVATTCVPPYHVFEFVRPQPGEKCLCGKFEHDSYRTDENGREIHRVKEIA